MNKEQEQLKILQEWIRRLVHIANCPSTYSNDYLRGYIDSMDESNTKNYDK